MTYKVLCPKTERLISVDADPHSLLATKQNTELVHHLFYMIAVSANIKEVSKPQRLMFWEAIKQQKLTVEEALQAFWKAYGDPYISANTGIEFRHLMKYVNEKRESKSNRLYSYAEVMKDHHSGNDMGIFYEITETLGEDGKRLWRKK